VLLDSRRAVGQLRSEAVGGLHERFSRIARSRPSALAVVAEDGDLTYGALERASDAWACQLAAAGVTPGDLVPVLLPRSPRLVIAVLAVLKAGAAYALLDPGWPAGRLREVMADLAPPVVVGPADPRACGDVPVWVPPPDPVPARPGFRPVSVDANAAATVFFTSGTTGRPKGVVTTHLATARLFAPEGFARFDEQIVVPLAAPTPWDAFSLELWSALLNGGRCLVVSDPYLSAAALREGRAVHGVNLAWLTSSLFNMIVDEDPDAFRGLEQVMIGGERLSPPHVRRFLRHHPGCALINGYGPVENTVFATTHRITDADCDLPGGIPLGRAVPGTRVLVLDGTRPCEPGETGEICLAGDGLALRYVNDPEWTAGTFVDGYICGSPGRLYRTGDLGTWGADGLLHFRGRADQQVKIRGHRVEPAGVERQIERLLPAVRTCRVLPTRDVEGTVQELLAFCVPDRPGDPLAEAPAVLAAHLVGYQRPAQVISVDTLPLTPRGKLDERALLALADRACGAGSPAVIGSAGPDHPSPPDDPVTDAVARAFASVLGVRAVPRDRSFAELGGTSLGAGRVCARICELLGRPVPVAALYDHPTVFGLAAALRSAAAPDGSRDDAPPDRPGAELTPMQVAFLTRPLVVEQDRSAYCLCTWLVEGTVDVEALAGAVEDVHRRHPSLRAAYRLDPRPHARAVDVPPPVPDLLPPSGGVEEAVRGLRAHLIDGLAPDEGVLWRTALAPVAEVGGAVFGCVVHHVAFDGWSQAVLGRDLADAYNVRRGAEVPPRPAPPSLACGQHAAARRLRSAPSARHAAHLRETLTGVPDLRWPSVPAGTGSVGPDRVEITVPARTVAGVDAVAAEAGVTRFAVLLALWGASLAEVTGCDDFGVGVPVAQRDDAILDNAVGCHIATVCLRLRGAALAGDRDAVRRTADTASRAIAAQDVPFATILDLTAPLRTGRPPLYQVLFAVQDNVVPRLALTGTRTRFLRQPYLDLALELHTEVWPDDEGGLCLEVSYRPEDVDGTTARRLCQRFAERLHSTVAG